jgi:hypothetical protein
MYDEMEKNMCGASSTFNTHIFLAEGYKKGWGDLSEIRCIYIQPS